MITPNLFRGFYTFTLMSFVALVLIGCGFHLRGADGALETPFKTMYVAVDARSPLGSELVRNLRANGDTKLVATAKEAEATLEILQDNRNKTVLSLNSAGRVREFALTHQLRFRVTDAVGREVLMPTEINLRRTVSFNETQVLAKEAEEALLFRDMQTDMVRQILRRVGAIKLEGK
jgi:LPS-assembly lipoprotein